APTNEFYA
nr:Chain E, Syndecan-4 [Rattus norvegicus]5A2P_F Chain F, Syndecan-4 [Rattus norvegicus]5A2P_G Chain G, Syndecan-4 [Rattus norvegicus]5A2P_H Chain H, Syndecan-4 [Rattus norvegicus]5G1D_C Chain C, Syndecan-4 [Rattus norvegicus]5G1D_D Chain D, Syndecan-4 [Rattus norvegicus]8BLV_C Chain C, Syndecan-4 [Homo sapiens]8BLV_D Chain D, Syndecan-4 [Homo sapiens]